MLLLEGCSAILLQTYCITIIIMKYTHSHGVLELSEIYISGVGLKLYALELHTWGGLILYVIQLLVLA